MPDSTSTPKCTSIGGAFFRKGQHSGRLCYIVIYTVVPGVFYNVTILPSSLNCLASSP